MRKETVRDLTPEERAYFEWEHKNHIPAQAVEVVGPYSLHVTFVDGTDATINFEQALWKIYNEGKYYPLIDPAYFARVEVNEDGVLTWPNGIDFNPTFIYKWDEHLAMIEQHRQEEASSASGAT